MKWPRRILCLLITGLAAGQETQADLETCLAGLRERAREIELAIVQFNLGIAPEGRFLESIAPRATGDLEALAAEHAGALQELARLAGRHRELAAGGRALPAASPGGEARPHPAEGRALPAEPALPAVVAPEPRPGPMQPLELPFPRPSVDTTLLADALFKAGAHERALALYGALIASGRGGAAARYREALCMERLAWEERRAGGSTSGGERLRLAREKFATLAEADSGSKWADAARFSLADIEWRLEFEARGPLPKPPAEPVR